MSEKGPRLRRFNASPMIEQLRYYKQHPGTVRGVSTGFKSLDYVTGGLQTNELILLAARPGVGKSMLALNIADAAVKQGYAIAFFSQEMSEEQLLWRLTSMRSGIPQSAVQYGYYMNQFGVAVQLTDEDYALYEETAVDITTWDIGVYVGGITTDAMREAVKASKKQIGLVITDHIGLHTDLISQAQYQRMTYVSRSLKDMKLEFGIPIIAVAQLNRSVESREGKKPQMSDLRDSGSLEQDADQVWAMWREDYYSDVDEERTARYVKVSVDVLKNRNGQTAPVYLMFDKWTGRFYEPGEEVQGVPEQVQAQAKDELSDLLGVPSAGWVA